MRTSGPTHHEQPARDPARRVNRLLPGPRPGQGVLALQPTAGNRAVAQLLTSRTVRQPNALAVTIQSAAGNQVVTRMLTDRRLPSQPPMSGPRLQRAVVPSGGDVVAAGDDEYKRVFTDYQRLLEAGEVYEADKAEVDHAVALMNEAARDLRAKQSKGSTAMGLALGGLAIAGVLAADDVTVVGVVDDVAIPPVLIAAGVAGLLYLALRSPDSEIQAAAARLNSWTAEATKVMAGILLAQKVGKEVSSKTVQLAIHLARILGSPVGGQDPDHQKDPNRDKNHWWNEIKSFVKQIADEGLTPKQLAREFAKYKVTREMVAEILAALKTAAKMMEEELPNFPPVTWP